MADGKSNCYLDVEKSQSNPIYKITVDILKHTNFFKLSLLPQPYHPSIFSNYGILFDMTRPLGVTSVQLDEQWFNLTKDTLRDALQITPVNNNQAFTSPSSSDALINFINELGYPKLVRNLSNVITNDMFQPWRALTTIINLCLTRKTSGFERPRALVLQILWGEKESYCYCDPEFSVHQADHLSPSEEAQFHPRPDSLLHLPNEEHVLRYLKSSTKGTKREVFGMPIHGNLITADIQGESYYQEYLEKVAKNKRYLAGETGSDPDSLVPKPTKTAKKFKLTALKADPRPPVSKPASSQQPKPKPSSAKSQGKKRKLVTEISDKPSQARKTRPNIVSKQRKPISSLRSVDESVAEDMLVKEPRVDDEDAEGIGGKLKEYIRCAWGPLSPVVIREPERCREREKKKRTSIPTGSSGYDESSLLYAKLGLTNSEGESDEDVSGTDAGVQGHTGPNPGDAEASQPLPSLVVHAGSILEHMDLDVADVSTQPHPEQMDESFGDLFFNDKPSKADNDKATVETEAESMVSVTIQQDTSLILPMATPIIDLTSRPESPKAHQLLKATSTETTTTTTTTTTIIYPPPSQPQQSTTDSMLMKRIDHMQLYEALEKFMNRDHSEELAKDLAEARQKKKKRNDLQKMPHGSPPHQPPPPPLPTGPSRASGSPSASGSSQVPPSHPPPLFTNQEGQSKGSATPSSSKIVVLAEYQGWATTDTRLRPSISLTPADIQINDDMAPDAQAQSSDDEDIGNSYIPKVNLRQDWWKPLEVERPATPEPVWSIPSSNIGDIAMFMDWFCKRQEITELKPQDLEGPVFELVKVFYPNVIHLQYQMEECYKLLTNSIGDSILRHNINKPLPLGSPPCQKMKVAYYPNVGLEKMVPDQMWIEEECKYDVAAIIKVFSMYGYDYMKKIVLRRADLNEHVIAKRDFKYLYLSDFEDLYLLNLQEDFQLGIESYQTQLNLTKPQWDATGFEYKHDYTVIDSPRAVTFQDRYGVQMIMRFNKIHKFCDGTLQYIDEALDYRVKEFKINRINQGLNTRFWTRKDVDRSKEFMFAIQKWLKTRRIFRNLESFVGGRVGDGDYRLLKRIE
nr:hypothetical protein [Tanacetum cinerariifolium]